MLRRRLFMQLHVFTGSAEHEPVTRALAASRLEGVLYQDVNDPLGLGVLLMAEDPERFLNQGRALFRTAVFSGLTRRPEFTMIGATYATGHEPDPDDWLLYRPRRTALNPTAAWTVWYPLRRKPEFALLPREEQGKILMEHAMSAKPYGEAGLASDIRLSCYGLDTRDNEFVLGLVGPALYPLSHLVQSMRKTQQTARYIASMGPFFTGRVVWRGPLVERPAGSRAAA